MVSVAVVHYSFRVAGGAEKLAGSLVKALRESGFDAELVTSKLDSRVYALLGLPELPCRVIPEPLTVRMADSVHKRVRRFGKFMSYFTYRHLCSILESEELKGFDLVVETQLNHPLPVDASYIHYPVVLQRPSSTSLLRRFYDGVMERLWSRMRGTPKLILTNSTWTASKIEQTYPGLAEVRVLHPPVDYEFFAAASREDREKLIITVSRLIPSKRVDAILRVAAQLPEYKFALVGSTLGASNEKYVKYLASTASNVEVMPNASRELVRELLGKARFYLHPPYPEHFGIAVAEAAAAGAVPIVLRDGGAWTDIVSKIDRRLGYEDIGEVPRIVRNLEKSPDLEELRERSMRVASTFKYEVFRSNVREVFGELLRKREAGKRR